jgi:hypothetical protein
MRKERVKEKEMKVKKKDARQNNRDGYSGKL